MLVICVRQVLKLIIPVP